MFDETIQPYFEGANLKEEETTVHKRIFIAFSDLAVLIALKNQTLTGYGVNKYFLKKVGYTASPSTVYTTLVAIERKDWINALETKVDERIT